MKTPERCQWRHFIVFIVNCKHIWIFVPIVEFEQTNVCWVHIAKTNSFENKTGYIMLYVTVFSMWTKVIKKWHLNLYHHNATGKPVRNFSRGFFRRWSWLKYAANIQNDLLYICLFTDFTRWNTNYTLLDTTDFKLL